GPRLLLLDVLPQPQRSAGRDRLRHAAGIPDRRGRDRARHAHVHPAALGAPARRDLPARADPDRGDGSRVILGRASRGIHGAVPPGVLARRPRAGGPADLRRTFMHHPRRVIPYVSIEGKMRLPETRSRGGAMTGKSDFTEQEWDAVLQGPPAAGTIVATASKGGTFKESFAIAKAYAEARQEHGASELLDAIVSAKPKVDRHLGHSLEEVKSNGLQHVRDAVGVLETKATAEEVD